MKIKIAIVALIPLAASIALQSSARARQTANSSEAPTTISPDPTQSVWAGIYTAEQTKRGEALYAQRCARCHAPDLTGGEIAPALYNEDFNPNCVCLSLDYL